MMVRQTGEHKRGTPPQKQLSSGDGNSWDNYNRALHSNRYKTSQQPPGTTEITDLATLQARVRLHRTEILQNGEEDRPYSQ